MRIQHNIMSMNAYRNYNNNANALSKNLEKLSSGYKINRAGDDAAGLAISEKMRAQIKGLDAARKNVKDGISLVKTAEGAMQEIQDMLSRMKYLATQSANGTYDDDVDRKALQNEVDQLNSEINRIADSANFNGTKLLDGSLAGEGGGSKTTAVAKPSASFTITENKGTKAVATLTFVDASKVGLDGLDVSVSVNGKNYTYHFDAVATKSGTKFEIKNGEDVIGTAGSYKSGHALGVVKTNAKVTKGEIVSAIVDKLQADLGSDFSVSDGGSGKLKIEATKEGADTLKNVSGTISYKDYVTNANNPTAATYSATLAKTDGKDTTYSAAAATVFKLSTKADKLEVYTLNGKKFVFMQGNNTKVAEEMNKITDSSITVINMSKAISATQADEIAAQLNKLTGMNITATAGGTLYFNPAKGGGNTSGGGLQLQIGDTGDDYNQLDVVVKDLHAAAIGCAGVDISSISGAQAAIDTVKDCINYVSEIRGTLGATQNRLEHTANNLSVMQENIQDAESTIRDTDVADEMMAYTKNNILIQSAQAMLAQANAVPQGVLQLLQ